MLKYYDCAVVFQEIPDEITLAIDITNCPHRCPECHSPWLRKDIGTKLTINQLVKLLEIHPDITCICFMGGDGQHGQIAHLAEIIHTNTSLKVAMYSGDDQINPILVEALDYYKVGSYQKDLGPLDSPTTNQKLYVIDRITKDMTDITYKFRNHLGGC